jgi:type IV secretion system protein TrbF
MFNPFKREATEKTTVEPITPYMRAKQEWDDRIGQSRVQAHNWRGFAITLLLIVLFLLVGLIISISKHETKIFVAEVSKEGRVVNVAPLTVPYAPSDAQKEYFLAQFIKMIKELPLDPVLAKQKLVNAYYFLTQTSAEKMNTYLRENNPLESLGKKTVTLEITDINPISKNSYEMNWIETSTDINGQSAGVQYFSSVFTIVEQPPRSQKEILINPLGIYIIDFHITAKN